MITFPIRRTVPLLRSTLRIGRAWVNSTGVFGTPYHAWATVTQGVPQVVLAGDFNVMPTKLDVYRPERWLDDALFRPEVRAAFRELVAQGWTDAVRALHPEERIYTFWDYFRNAWARNAGLRIDHLLLSPAAARRLVAAGVDREVRGWEKASDHAPAWIEVTDNGVGAPLRERRPTREGLTCRIRDLRLSFSTPPAR